MFLLVFTTYSDDYDDQSQFSNYALFTNKKKAQERGIDFLYEEVVEFLVDQCSDFNPDNIVDDKENKSPIDLDNDDDNESDCGTSRDSSDNDSHEKSIKLEDLAKTLKARSYYSMKNVKELLNMVRGYYVKYRHRFHIVRLDVDVDRKVRILNHKTDNDKTDEEDEEDEDDDE